MALLARRLQKRASQRGVSDDVAGIYDRFTLILLNEMNEMMVAQASLPAHLS